MHFVSAYENRILFCTAWPLDTDNKKVIMIVFTYCTVKPPITDTSQ